MEQVRWGVLSTANINRRVIPAIRMAERGDLVAVASRSLEQATAYAREWDIPLALGSYEALLESDRVDALYISLPNHLHAEWTIRALRAGKHVLCEKPLALTLDEVDRIGAAAAESERVVAEAFMYRHHPQSKIVGEWVRSGRLGEVTLVRGTFNFTMTNSENIRMQPEMGGGSLWDVGIYPLSFAQYVLGTPPERVLGEGWVGQSGVDEHFAAQLHYPGGAVAQLSSAFRTSWYTSAEIIGTEGRLVLTRPFVALNKHRQLLFWTDKDEPEEIPVPDQYLYLGEIEDMHAAILDGTPPYLALQESRDQVHTILALYRSAREGRVVALSEIGG